MTWIPIFSISSQDFDTDLKLLKSIFNEFEAKCKVEHGYKFSPEAEFAMGWWFYDVYVRAEFIKKLVETAHLSNSSIKDERGIMKIIQKNFKQNSSVARVKIHGDKPFMAGYWSWLLK
jgi:hypothetical protein|tara:strand:- start:326 stop:679 length:354 start_codon:yes stop_codon:yes gene_type:complete